MDSASTISASAVSPLGFVDKARIVVAAVAAVAMLRTIGWMVAEPSDPLMAITFTRSGRAILAIAPALTVLTVVAGIIGTVLAGRRLPEAGMFAAGIGVAGLSLRGGSMQMVLANGGATSEAGRRALMAAMMADCLLWSAILVLTWMAASWTWRWVWANGGLQSPVAVEASEKSNPPGKADKVVACRVGPQVGWPAMVVTAVTGAFVVWLTVARTPAASIARGQTIAAVAGGLYLGAMLARYFTGISDPRWYLLGVPVGALIGYLVAYLSCDMSWAEGGPYKFFAYLATTPPHDLARPLPIDYLAVGVSAALAGFWGGQRVEHVVVQEAS